MPELPTGTVTFLFSDIEGSTRLEQAIGGAAYQKVLEDQAALMRKAFTPKGGVEISTAGDSFFVVFQSAPRAFEASVDAQRLIASHDWPEGASITVRMGLHTGEGKLGGDNYIGIDVNRGARIAAAGHGGQVLISGSTRGLVDGCLKEGISIKDLGEHRLKDLERPERIFQIVMPGLKSDFPSLKSLDARPHNLPSQMTSFIGRRSQIDAITSLIEGTRLLTLTGPGGTGKTRLCLAAGAELLDDFKDGVFFVPLGPISDAGLVVPTIAQTVGVKEAGTKAIEEMLHEHLSEKQLLLLLDNFEQILPAAASVSRLLAAAPKVKAIVTSRAVLHLAGEQEYPVPPMALPDYHNLPSLAALSQYEAVALFIQRASAVLPGFEVTNENAPAVAEICYRLDGLPLAIELAAARVKILAPQAILERLNKSLTLLTGGAADLPARQQTLRNAIAWSYDLLSDSERSFFRRLSVFVGGFTFESVDAVCNSAGELEMDTLDALASLGDKSLIKSRENSRFLMLATLRDFGMEELASDPDYEVIHENHATYFSEFTQEAAKHFMTPAQAEWMDRIEQEHDNIRAALRWSIERDRASLGLRIGYAIWRFWQFRGHLSEGRRWMSELLELASAQARDLSRAQGLSAIGSLVYWQNDFEATRGYYEESLELFRELGEESGIAESLYNLGYLVGLEGDRPEAIRLYEECLSMYLKLGDQSMAAYAEMSIGMIHGLDRNLEAARPFVEKSLQFFRHSGDGFGLYNTVGMMSEIHAGTGLYDESISEAREALEIAVRIGDLSGIGILLEYMTVPILAIGFALRAVILGGAAEGIKKRLEGGPPASLMQIEDPRISARDSLSEDEIEAAWQRGFQMSTEEAVAYGLADEDASTTSPSKN